MKKTIVVIFLLLVGGCTQSFRTHTKEQLRQIEKNPSRHLGKLYAFEGSVINAEETDDSIAFQMFITYSKYDFDGAFLTVLFDYSDYSTPTAIAKGHEVKVLGYTGDIISGQNLFGGTVNSLVLKAIAVWDETAGLIYWQRSEEENYKKWASGELFTNKRKKKQKKIKNIDKLEPFKSVNTSEKIDVSLALNKVIDKNGKLQFNGYTNLPDNMGLMITLTGPKIGNRIYTAQDKIEVFNGKFVSEWFSSMGKALPAGEYQVEITSPIPTVQASKVRNIIGLNGEKLTGEFVKPAFILGEYYKKFSYVKKFSIQ